MSIWIVCAIVIAAAVSIAGAVTTRRYWYLLAKPLAMMLVMVLAVQRDAASDQAGWLYTALALSLLGDVLLMFPARFFVGGLLAFLCAHLAYIGLFFSFSGTLWHWSLLPLLALALLYWTQLARFRPRLFPAIVVYTVALLLMCVSALAWAAQQRNDVLVLGVLLFAVSDGVLGWNKFARPIPLAQLWILGSYFSAQTLIVWAL